MTDNCGEECVSYIALTMDKNLDLNIYTHRGRPTKSESMKSEGQLCTDLRKLKKEMNYKDGTEILLALSVATDDMIHHVAMFPEVFIFMSLPTQIV